jgi:hypothetical protein
MELLSRIFGANDSFKNHLLDSTFVASTTKRKNAKVSIKLKALLVSAHTTKANMEEVSFPRGGRSYFKKDVADGGDNNNDAKERKRARSSSSKPSNGSAAAAERDFLFGAPPTATTVSSKKRKISANLKNKTDSAPLLLSANRSSLMPLGGGGVVVHQNHTPGTIAATSKHGSHDKKQQQHQQRSREPCIEALSFSKLAKNTKLLAVVREVQDEFCVVSLPNFLTGYILRNAKKSSNNSNLKVSVCNNVPFQ